MPPDAKIADSTDRPASHRLVLVTGPSGAGRSTALNALEDLGFEVIDNLPLTLVPRLLDGPPLAQPLALGLDPRNRDFSVAALNDLAAQLRAAPAVDVEIVYLDCHGDVLLRRFSETRRRHPLAPAEGPAEGIARELDLLGPVRALADMLIDTSDLTPHDLRAEVARWFGSSGGVPRLAVSIHSFSYKRGVPRSADMVFDCRFLRNPYWEPALRGLDGQAEAVAAYVAKDARFRPFFDKVLDLALLLLPAYRDEGKSHLSIAFGCTGGQHRSVMVAEKLTNALADAGWRVSKRHRELERRGRAAPGTGSGTTG
ncbi:MAG: RNase adapter RapZ [Paracoccaceae bacterium]